MIEFLTVCLYYTLAWGLAVCSIFSIVVFHVRSFGWVRLAPVIQVLLFKLEVDRLIGMAD